MSVPEHLSGERRRLELLLAQALRVAVGGTTVQPLALLEVICDYVGTDPARPYFVELREREAALAGGPRTRVVYDRRGELTQYELLPGGSPRPPLTEEEIESTIALLRETAP